MSEKLGEKDDASQDPDATGAEEGGASEEPREEGAEPEGRSAALNAAETAEVTGLVAEVSHG